MKMQLATRFLSCVTSPSRGLMTSSVMYDGSKNLLKKLRKETGYPLINCRQALQIAEYDYDKAREHLIEIARQKGLDKLESERNMSQGLIGLVSSKHNAVIVEMNCETDFVAKTSQFQQMVKQTSEYLLNNFTMPKHHNDIQMDIPVDEIMEMKITKNDETMKETLILAAGKLRENVQLRRAVLISTGKLADNYHIGTYVHPSAIIQASRPNYPLGLYAAAVVFSTEESSSSSKLIGRDLAQHIVGMNPTSIGEPPELTEIKPERKKNKKRKGKKQQQIEEEVEEKEKVFRRLPLDGSRELLKQSFLLDSENSCADWLEGKGGVSVERFVRFRVGEDLKENSS